jgi:hypothetical protein
LFANVRPPVCLLAWHGWMLPLLMVIVGERAPAGVFAWAEGLAHYGKSHHYDHEDYSSQNHYDKQAHKNHHGHYDVFAIRCVCLGGGVDPPWMQYRSKHFRKNHGHAVCAVALPLALRTRAHLPSDRPDLKPT